MHLLTRAVSAEFPLPSPLAFGYTLRRAAVVVEGATADDEHHAGSLERLVTFETAWGRDK
ncbi:MAG: hypothetical protein CR217_17015 [Beijerinckiaceae bacterium]|nr:MAG: hypothetical protein CR217_17015 [Beijerinckiaceae bacterium]